MIYVLIQAHSNRKTSKQVIKSFEQLSHIYFSSVIGVYLLQLFQ